MVCCEHAYLCAHVALNAIMNIKNQPFTLLHKQRIPSETNKKLKQNTTE